jgi:hypothetical protein
MDLKSMRQLFNKSQHLHKHQKCFKQITQLFQQNVSYFFICFSFSINTFK